METENTSQAGRNYKYCTLDKAESYLAEPLQSPELSAREAGQIEEEATDLANRAYVKQDTSARGLAERLLYLTHSVTAFSPPIDSVCSRIWPTLIRAKLNSDLNSLGVPQIIDADFMVQEFQRAIELADQRDNNLIAEMAQANDLKSVRKYVKNYLASTGGFTHQLFALTKVSTGPLKRALLDNLADEFEGDKEHRELRYMWPRRLGVEIVPADAVRDPEYLTESFSLQNFRTAASLLPKPHLGVGMFYSVEAVFPGICTRLRPALLSFGIEEIYLEHLVLHEEADVSHLADGLAAICESIKDGSQLATVLIGALGQLNLRHRMFMAMRHEYGYPLPVLV